MGFYLKDTALACRPEPHYGAMRMIDLAQDLSGTMSGAGGVGGLIAVFSCTNGPQPTAYFPVYDGNGNVMGLVSTSGVTVAEYEYGSFGETLKADGPAADANPFRFSTKYRDTETGLGYWGYRYYDPETGRWASRDPIGEKDGRALYLFVHNQPCGRVDPVGLTTWGGVEDRVASIEVASGESLSQVLRRIALSFPDSNWDNDKFLHTCLCGTIDLRHFFNIAARVAGGAVRVSVLVEEMNTEMRGRRISIGKDRIRISAKVATTYRDDIPSNAFGGLFGEEIQKERFKDTAGIWAAFARFLGACKPVGDELLDRALPVPARIRDILTGEHYSACPKSICRDINRCLSQVATSGFRRSVVMHTGLAGHDCTGLAIAGGDKKLATLGASYDNAQVEEDQYLAKIAIQAALRRDGQSAYALSHGP